MIDFTPIKIIHKLRPNSQWRHDPSKAGLEAVEWLDDTIPPTQVEWDAAANEVELDAIRERFVQMIQARMDAFAQTRNYDNMLSACTYATSTVPKFQAEGQYCVEARDATWAAAYAILDEVLAGERPIPQSMSDIENELPVLAWPGS